MARNASHKMLQNPESRFPDSAGPTFFLRDLGWMMALMCGQASRLKSSNHGPVRTSTLKYLMEHSKPTIMHHIDNELHFLMGISVGVPIQGLHSSN